jgi:hypothetical protein
MAAQLVTSRVVLSSTQLGTELCELLFEVRRNPGRTFRFSSRKVLLILPNFRRAVRQPNVRYQKTRRVSPQGARSRYCKLLAVNLRIPATFGPNSAFKFADHHCDDGSFGAVFTEV